MTDTLVEEDLALINALQVAPRVSWAEAARVLGSKPATLAARWRRLREEGLAWVTAHPAGTRDVVTSFVEVDCAPGARADVVRALCRDARAVTVEESARGRDLLLTVMTPDLPALTAFVLDDLPKVRGVQGYRTYLGKDVHRQGSDWRLGALDRKQVAALESAARRDRPEQRVEPPSGAWPLIEALAVDGRRTAADLARITGRNPATVRRQLARLLASQVLAFRCEVAQVQSHWPIACTWLARVPALEHERTVAALRTLPELRVCVSTTGDTNMMFTVWTRSLTEVLRIERLLGDRMPWLNLVESAVTLRMAKRMGWLLDADGRSTGEVVAPSALKP
ncbi:Lrp/AsnC family transcriptional regulator [Streptomyces sp. NWU339]|uniref:Lrp/AsnC family transcriptional regulator n=1 Tax=Streptomyces sp. NWU339 TaxID=2185284 RepID=UPI000D67CFBF|nr:Lrp/AsnC family transcriptional regulator [Streptomyces sp. NWU339]PWI06218.1 Lrp/AsnC family transcriptional regulator [Streptomyces sp. NWU339]